MSTHGVSRILIQVDACFIEDGRYVWSPEQRDRAWADCFARLEAALESGRYSLAALTVGVPASGKSTYAAANNHEDIVIFDAVFSTRQFRERAINIARRFAVPIEAWWMDTPLEECLRRNKQRDVDRRIPEDALRQFHNNLSREPPNEAEGFVLVRKVQQ